MTSDEQTLNLFKLFVAVRDKGGYDIVSRKDLWDLVAEESGFGLIISSTVKVLYVEYLNVLESWLEKIVQDRNSTNSCSSNGDGTGFGFSVSPDIQSSKKNDDLHDSNFSDCDDTVVVLKTDRDTNIAGCGESLCQLSKRAWDIYDTDDLYEDEDTSLEVASNTDENSDDIDKSHGLNIQKYENASMDGKESNVVFSNGGRNCDGYDPDNKEGVILDSTSVEEHNFSHERKCESMLGMVNWITEIAKNPCNPVIGLLPESSKWKLHGNEEIWKQVLLIREAILKGRINSYSEQFALQNKRPCMFDDHQSSSYNLRKRTKSREILPSETSSSRSLILGTEDQLDQEILVTTDSWMPDYMGKFASKQIPLGPKFQVDVPKWGGITSESDSKWLGTRVWPLDKEKQALIHKHDLIGKGREDSCKCQVRGSTQCTQCHILKKRYKVKLEIGSAFYQWKFDRMGEEVRLCWTEKEEHKFKGAMRSSSASLKRSFRTRNSKYFPSKSREDIVCYYFNVFLFHRRGFQNRFTPDNICSDDELEFK